MQGAFVSLLHYRSSNDTMPDDRPSEIELFWCQARISKDIMVTQLTKNG
jgi:hypothetical protein